MFGFEFQTANAFEAIPTGFPIPAGPGIRERETAWRHDATGTTLEGDESRRPKASADLEFVTPARATVREAVTAAQAAVDLARALQEESRRGSGAVLYRRGDVTAGGVWLKDCAIRFYDDGFHAQAQGTVGVPLAGFEALLSKVWERSKRRDQVKREVDRMAPFAELPGYQAAKAFPSLRGFLTACHLFLLRATDAEPGCFDDPYGVNADLTDSTAYFDFSGNASVRAVNQRVRKLPAPPATCRVLVNSDSPKSMFAVLHRTDFHSMFRSLSEPEREILARPATEVLWPANQGDINQVRLFPLPYRIDPAAADVRARLDIDGVELDEWKPAKKPEKDLVRGPVTWTLLEHGPTVAQWWESVRFGDTRRDGLRKDVASPPPGFRGRDRQYLDRFPQSQEDKTAYYGMGAFPMDHDEATGAGLAVFEYRDLMADIDVPVWDDLSFDRWVGVVEVFAKHYLPKLG
ncbi:hypothetical protein Ga0074812_10963 [Parafrankia irregularis]|uniref:Uncharacterized protein n=1 Tax=Parafrankia irregularis TaxID=795642 RepID=A0A0S4QMF8_9ACTN|nr:MULTISPECIES: hypothetical protein [Parafrankia]MBE3200512.1 hypothetical protein [Parafrankia sp. CH37]CUU56843.1 hypothetical protein Ga0074812_10963 [Parafrankia irregularis]